MSDENLNIFPPRILKLTPPQLLDCFVFYKTKSKLKQYLFTLNKWLGTVLAFYDASQTYNNLYSSSVRAVKVVQVETKFVQATPGAIR